MANPKLLITGINGFLGQNLARIAATDWDVIGTAHTSYERHMPEHIIGCDLTDYDHIKSLIKKHRPDATIHLAAQSDANWCQQEPKKSEAINCIAAQNLAGIISDTHTPFVFASTDLVFDGKGTFYSEVDAVNPLSAYGEHKAMAEQRIHETYCQATVARLPVMFGPCQAPATSFLHGMVKALRNQDSLSLFQDEWRSFAWADDIAHGLLLMLAARPELIHIGGRERLNRVEFGNILAAVMGVEHPDIRECYRFEVPMPAPRPRDVSLNSDKAKELGYNPTPVFEALERCLGHIA